MAIQHFKTKEDFISWVKHTIESDKEFLYNEEMPPEFLRKVKRKEYELIDLTFSDYMEYYFKFGLPKNELKKVLHNLKRLKSMRCNQFIDLELFEKNINKVLDSKMLSYINGITDIDIKDIEPHQYYVFFNTVEEINFFTKSKIMKYKDLFSIPKDKYDRAIQLLKDSADKVMICFDDNFIDHQVRVRLPINPKVAISNMFFYLTFRGSKNNITPIVNNFYKILVSYFIGENSDKKKVQEELHYKFLGEIASSYCVKDERSLGNYSHYFYEPSIKLNYNYKN